MRAAWAVRSVADRLKTLPLAADRPSYSVPKLLSDLEELETLLDKGSKSKPGEENLQEVMRVAYEIEDAAESYTLQELQSKGKPTIFVNLSATIYQRSSKGRTFPDSYKAKVHELIKKLGGNPEGSDADGKEKQQPAGSTSTSTSAITDGKEKQQPAGSTSTSAITDGAAVKVVRMEKDQSAVEEHLLDTSSEEQVLVVAIHGKEGSGKTTLARVLYNDSKVALGFDVRAWIAVGEKYKFRDVLESLLYSVTSGSVTNYEIRQMIVAELISRIHRELDKKRFLIVLDDVPSKGILDELTVALPRNHNNKSRIVVTAKLKTDLAGYSKPVFRHEMNPLTGEDLWTLFQHKSGLSDAVSSSLQSPSFIEEMKKIINTCCGLPLGISILAGMFRGRHPQDFNKMIEQMQGGQKVQELEQILALSYKELPSHLKQCILYLGQFPFDDVISVEKLCLHWMAEGMIIRDTKKSPFEIAKSYYNELISRSLVSEAEKDGGVSPSSQRFASCKLLRPIHQMLRNEAKKEKIFKVLEDDDGKGDNSSSYVAFKLSTSLDKFKATNISSDMRGAIRCILVFDETSGKQKGLSESINLKEFQSTRVLEFHDVDFQGGKSLQGMEKLVFLKYLSFQGCRLKEMPQLISTLLLLETLDMGVIDSCEMAIPNVLHKLSKLRHLYFPRKFQLVKNEQLKLDTLTDLETLQNFHSGRCRSKDLKSFVNLTCLTCIVAEEDDDLKNTIKAMEGNLQYTSLVVENFDTYTSDRRDIVKEMFESEKIHVLDFEGHLGRAFRSFKIGPNFTKIVLNGSECSDDLLPLLKNLPNLKSLVLCNDASRAEKMVFHGKCFPQLASLKLENLHSLEKLEVKDAGSSHLAVLTIKNCVKLGKLPEELAEMEYLENLAITGLAKHQTEVNGINEARKKKRYKFLATTFE